MVFRKMKYSESVNKKNNIWPVVSVTWELTAKSKQRQLEGNAGFHLKA